MRKIFSNSNDMVIISEQLVKCTSKMHWKQSSCMEMSPVHFQGTGNDIQETIKMHGLIAINGCCFATQLPLSETTCFILHRAITTITDQNATLQWMTLTFVFCPFRFRYRAVALQWALGFRNWFLQFHSWNWFMIHYDFNGLWKGVLKSYIEFCSSVFLSG